MPKHYKDMMDEIINKMEEDAPTNSVAGGGVDMAPNAAVMSPKMMKRKKNKVMNKKKLERRKVKWFSCV